MQYQESASSKKRIALLAGGKSGEREISLRSGAGAKTALESAGYDVVLLDPAVKNDLKMLIDGRFDAAFICLHGRYGEDGTIQGLLELLDIPYIGSGVFSSALSIDKAKSKLFYEAAGIRTPMSVTVKAGESPDLGEINEKVGAKSVVKPATEGSSLGFSIVESEEALGIAIAEALECDNKVLVETYVAGEEYTVAVIGNDDPVALPVIQIIPVSEFYDFESKYTPGGSTHLCPAPLTDERTEEVKALAVKAHEVLECRGLSRSDFILDGEGRFWILETNTIPGMTETSLLPDAGRAAGIGFSDLCARLVELALESAQ